ncbi:MAG: hypothetical protein KKB03_00720 [Nanoarchaeota archaeon]|nr:hypothetical protein [Nanoarchaeota archaeon]MBU1135534.1 hypothetical protein [Nanoarchaeota archaeon]MBU2519752.1 hypothetical protein [Nanoarchaeota archaeon]
MKAITLISTIIFIAVTIAAIGVIYYAGMPVINKLQAAATIENMRGTMSELDEIIQKVASEGKGSKRTLNLKMDRGTIFVNGSEDVIYWYYETDAEVISPRTYQKYGNVLIGANMETNATEGTIYARPAYILSNEHLRVYFKKFGGSDNWTSTNSSQFLMAVYNKDLNTWMPLDRLTIWVDNQSTSETGTGYTTIETTGKYLPYGTVTAYMQSGYINYTVNFTLESGADFIEIEIGQGV